MKSEGKKLPRSCFYTAAGLVLVSKIEGGKKIVLAPPRLLKQLAY